MSLVDDDSEEDDELANSDVREAYKQASNNMRSFIVLRFRHFATFSVILGLFATAVFRIPELSDHRLAVTVAGAFITLLFWALDYRTGEYLSYYARLSSEIEKVYFSREKRVQVSFSEKPRPSFLSATMITNLIFLTVLIGWLGLMYVNFHASYSRAKSKPDQTSLILSNPHHPF